METIAIIGAGHAGLTLAREIRQQDKSVNLVILSQEEICAYYKPNLSKALSTGKSPDQLITKEASQLEAELQCTLLHRVCVTRIEPEIKVLTYEMPDETQRTLKYDRLVLATGATPMPLPSHVADSAQLLAINHLEDYRKFRNVLNTKKQVAIIGAGFVGCELASDLSSQGYQVSVIDRAEWPLNRAVPEVMGSAIRTALSSHMDVRWFLGKTIEAVDRLNEQTIVRFSDGFLLAADVVVSAIGLRPNTELARQINAQVDLGIVVDAFSQTSIPHIYALGDCVEYHGSPLPFISPATHAAKALAKTLTGQPTELLLPSLAVPVKIGPCPTLICPSLGKRGVWEVQGSGIDLEAHYLNEFGQLTGFALTGKCVSRKMELARQCQSVTSDAPLSLAS